jgi:hypothetical protein
MRGLAVGVALLVITIGIYASRGSIEGGLGSAFRLTAAHLGGTADPKIAEEARPAPPERAAVITELNRIAEARQAQQPSMATSGHMHELLRKAASMMAGSEAMGALRDMQDARGHVRELGTAIADRLLAGQDAKDLQEQQAKAAADLARATGDFAKRLTDLGVRMTPEQAELIAIAPNGDDMVALLGMQANVARFVAQLRDTVEQNRTNPDLLKRYYGLNVVLCEMVETLQADVRDRIKARYLPRLDVIEQENLDLQHKAQENMKQAPAPEQQGYAANLKALAGTAEIIPAYRHYLSQQGEQLDDAVRHTRTLLDLAANTASTMENTVEVLDMMNAANRDFGAVINLMPPGTLPLDNDALRQEFERISRKLNEPTS